MKKMLTVALVAAMTTAAMGQTNKPKTADAPAPAAPAKAAATLAVGDKAPDFSATNFVKGKKIAKLEEGKAYVVEFWATWCGPCIRNIPHLTEIQKANKDVTVIGMASSERPSAKGGKDDRLKGVQNFVKSQGAKMNYTVAFDEPGDMRKNWLVAAGQNGIPCAFVVDPEGKIAFIGHPASPEFETKVKEVGAAAKKIAAEKKSKNKGKKKGEKEEDSEKDETADSGTDADAESGSDHGGENPKDAPKSTDSDKPAPK